MLSDSDKAAAFSAHSLAYRLLPSTLSGRLWVFLCLLGGGDVALCGMIHKVLHLFGAKSTNSAQNRADCVFSCILCMGERNSGLTAMGLKKIHLSSF